MSECKITVDIKENKNRSSLGGFLFQILSWGGMVTHPEGEGGDSKGVQDTIGGNGAGCSCDTSIHEDEG